MKVPADRAGAGDCERCRPGLIAQPVNAVSSLAYVAVGAAILRSGPPRPVERLVAWSAIAAGIGSVAFHGPGGPASKLAHDTSLISLLGAIGLADLVSRDLPEPLLALVPLAALALASTPVGEAGQGGLGVLVASAEVVRIRAKGKVRVGADRAMAPAAAVGAAAHLLGRTGGPFCRPDARCQPHALWHLITAALVGCRARSLPS